MLLLRAAMVTTVAISQLALASGQFAVAGTHKVKPACQNPPSATSVIQQEPWQQTWFDAPEKIWPFSTGVGQTVAIIDTGVDATHPQLAGKVLPGYDFVRNVPQGDVDCVPHGTPEAGVVAAKQVDGIGFYGLAPDAKILPIRITERAETDDQSDQLNNQLLADGINYAVDHGASVIDCAVVSYQDDPHVAAAVKRAIGRGVVVVAMVGDSHSEDRDGIGPTAAWLTPYPANDPGVIGVGAVDSDGRRVTTSQIGPYVDLVAPGADVVASATVGQNTFDGTSIASAFVAAAAALLLSDPSSSVAHLSGSARVDAVSARLRATAAPELSDTQSMAYGAGLVDPYGALTEATTARAPTVMPRHSAPPPVHPNPAVVATVRAQQHAGNDALRLAEILGGVAAFLLLLTVMIRRGRAGCWRPVRAARQLTATDDVPEFVPGDALYEESSRST